MSSQDNSKLYFDITDIIDHGYAQNRVTGIQRVVINVISSLAERAGRNTVECLYFDRRRGHLCRCDADVLTGSDGEFDPELMRLRLGHFRNWTIFPDRESIRSHLQPLRQAGRRWLRRVRKIDIHVSSLLWPKRLEKFGLRRIRDRMRGRTVVRVEPLASLAPGDSLIMLGGNWHTEQMLEFAQRHRNAGGDVVQMVYDLIPHKFPEYCLPSLHTLFESWLHKIVHIASRYICISEHTGTDLREFLANERGVAATVTPVRLAHEVFGYARNDRIGPPTSRLEAYAGKDFVLCVGTLEVRKNGILLLHVWERLFAELGPSLPPLIFAGKRGWHLDEFDAMLAGSRVLQRLVEFVDAPTDAELAYLYGRCLFTAYPSHYEGWGLPVGEAAWFGKYSVASNAASLPEVCGNLVDYCEPTDAACFAATIRKALRDAGFVRDREARIRAASLRAWREVADDIGTAILAGRSAC